MDGVLHHRVVYQHDAQPFALPELQWLRVGGLHPVEAEDVAMHVAREMQLEGARRLPPIRIRIEAFEVRQRQHDMSFGMACAKLLQLCGPQPARSSGAAQRHHLMSTGMTRSVRDARP